MPLYLFTSTKSHLSHYGSEILCNLCIFLDASTKLNARKEKGTSRYNIDTTYQDQTPTLWKVHFRTFRMTAMYYNIYNLHAEAMWCNVMHLHLQRNPQNLCCKGPAITTCAKAEAIVLVTPRAVHPKISYNTILISLDIYNWIVLLFVEWHNLFKF